MSLSTCFSQMSLILLSTFLSKAKKSTQNSFQSIIEDPYEHIFEDYEVTSDDFGFIESNQLLSQDGFLSTPNDDHPSKEIYDKLLHMRVQLSHEV